MTTNPPLRLWLLLLLALLLPLHGAMASAVACPTSAVAMSSHPATHEAHEGHQAHGEQASGAASHAHACTGCCDLCSTPSLPNELPRLPAPAFTRIAYPGLSSQTPSFLSDGQERPPRRI